jgi:hypothetical protein
MRSVDDVIQRAERFSARDRRKLVCALADSNKATRSTRSRKRRTPRQALYESLLAFAGPSSWNYSHVSEAQNLLTLRPAPSSKQLMR